MLIVVEFLFFLSLLDFFCMIGSLLLSPLIFRGRLSCTFLPRSTSAGDHITFSIGVARRHKRATLGSFPVCFALANELFTILTRLSMNPLLRGYRGELVTMMKPNWSLTKKTHVFHMCFTRETHVSTCESHVTFMCTHVDYGQTHVFHM